MFQRCRTILFFLSVIAGANAQTIKDAYPDLESLSPEARTRGFKSQIFKRPPFSLSVGLSWPEWLKPDSREWIFALEAEESPSDERGYVEVVSQTEDDFFVVDRSPNPKKDAQDSPGEFRRFGGGETRIYRVTPRHVDHVTALRPGDGLFSSQVGVSRWMNKFDADGKLTESTAWIGTEGIWVLYSTTTYDYWPGSGVVQSRVERRTNSSSLGAAVSVIKFDEKGVPID